MLSTHGPGSSCDGVLCCVYVICCIIVSLCPSMSLELLGHGLHVRQDWAVMYDVMHGDAT